MPTALTGSLGWTGLHPLQLGGPPLVSNYDQTLQAIVRPLIAHVYQSDGVTSLGTLSVLNRPGIKLTLANGGPDSVTLEVASRNPVPVYGQVVYGAPVYGAQVVHGNVVKLTEQGGDGRVIYAGIVESLPDVIGPGAVSHQIVLTPFAVELGRAYVQAVYAVPTDVAQMVRDAVAATQHCHCDQVSVPPTTGLTGMGDFRNRPAQELIDTARAIAGYTWFWHVDVGGRVWFQQMGSIAAHTLKRGQDYQERTSNGGDIVDRKNKVVAVGGPTAAGTNAVAVYNGTSQAALGVRALNPPLAIPGVSDQATLQAIASSVGATCDRAWQRVSLKALPAFGQRIHASRPGGAMLRYWEPTLSSSPESETGAGYVGPLIGQSVDYDGLYQQIEAGDVPLTDQRDVDALVASLVSRVAALSVVVTDAALNVSGQVLTGTLQSGTGTVTTGGQRGTLWQLDQNQFAAVDPGGVTRVQQGNLAANGASTAGWKFRANDATGAPVFDSDQVFGDRVMRSLGIANGPTSPPQSFTSTGFTTITSTTLNFSVARSCNIFAPFLATGRVNTNNGNVGFVRCTLAGVTTSGNENFGVLANFAQTSSGWIFVTGLAAGSYTIFLEAAVNGSQTFDVFAAVVQAFQLGG